MNKEKLLTLCKNSGAKLKNKVVDAICEYDKDIFSMEPDDWISIFKQYKMQKSYLSEQRREISKIYVYAIATGKSTYNPFDSLELTVDNISEQINIQAYVSQKQLDKAIDNLSESLIGGCIAQMIYEGVRSYSDIFNLNIEDIDFKNSKINFDGYTVFASAKLMKYINDYIENNVYITISKRSKTGFRQFEMKNIRPNSFAKIIAYDESVDQYKNFLNSCTNIIKKINITKAQLYNSGFINFLYLKCDYSIKELELLIIGKKHSKSIKDILDRLRGYADEYGFSSGKTVNLRYYLKDYCNSFILQAYAI